MKKPVGPSEPRPGGRRASGDTPEPIARLRAICLALPETTEKIAWGEPTFRVGGKLFAQVDNHHHGADHVAVWLAMPLGAQEGLVYSDPVRFFVPPYVGRRGWIGVRLDRRPKWSAIAALVGEAYRLVASPRAARSRPGPSEPSAADRRPARTRAARRSRPR